jgi:hypothetical protein
MKKENTEDKKNEDYQSYLYGCFSDSDFFMRHITQFA